MKNNKKNMVAKIGLLPLYIELYDRMVPSARQPLEQFYQTIVAALRRRNLEVVTAPPCRLAPEFRRAVKAFESAEVDAIVTLHLAYSPSLESAAALAATDLPIIVLDTTPDWDFGPKQESAAIMRNHGIHGVQDMCNLLLRHDKRFMIEAGHWQRSDVLARVVTHARSAALTRHMRRARVGRIGSSFKGMGDFCVPETVLRKQLGMQVIAASPKVFNELAQGVSQADITREMANDRRLFLLAPDYCAAAHKRSVHAGLIVRRWIEKARLTAFTINFLHIGRSMGLPVMPFVEAGLAMKRGIGYAGEGDVLTAALVGALAGVFPETTFTEMFCPDWRGNRVLLSHMGEWNVGLASQKPRLAEYDFVYGKAQNPVLPVGCLKGGSAIFVNLAPMPGNTFRMILTSGNMFAPRGQDCMANNVHGWFKPQLPLNDFLATYSRLGGTHHAALVYDGCIATLTGFAEFMNWDLQVI